MIRFGWVLWHINQFWLFNAKSRLYINIKYTWFGLDWFYGISTIVVYLMPNPLNTYILNIHDSVWLFFFFFVANLMPKSYLYIYYKYTWFVFFFWGGVHGISTIVGYLMPNPIHAYILNIHELSTHFVNNIC